MAPKKSSKASLGQVTTDALCSDSLSLDASQDGDGQNWRDFMEQRKQRAIERRVKRKQETLNAHNERFATINGKIKQVVEKHNRRVRALRRPKVQRLLDLTRKKRDVEAKIDECQEQLQQAFLSSAKQLQFALEGRIEELS